MNKNIKTLYIGIDIGINGAITCINDSGDLLAIFKMPTVNRNDKNTFLLSDTDDLNISEFIIPEYKDSNRYINTKQKKYIKKSIKEQNTNKLPSKIIKPNKKIIKKTDLWYDIDTIKKYLIKLSEYVNKDPSRIKIVLEHQTMIFGKSKGSSLFLRGFGLLEGLSTNITSYNNIITVPPKEWQKYLYIKYLNNDTIDAIKTKNIDYLCKMDNDLKEFFPDILANILSMSNKKSINDTKIFSTLIIYYLYKSLLLSQISNIVDTTDNNCYDIYKTTNIINPNLKNFYKEMKYITLSHDICDSICLAHYGRLISQK